MKSVLFFLLLLSSVVAKASNHPNVILIMTDDQGYGDIAAHGNPIIKTPHLDKLHAESIRFTDFHVNMFCAPTRAALMTGRMSDRTHTRTTINLRNHMNVEETTMAQFFKASGYTTALFGKWHLGGNYPFRPMDRGFDQWVGHGDGGTATNSDWWGNDRMNDTYWRNNVPEKFEGFGTDVFFNETKRFIKENKENPFFVYLPTNVPHSPWNVLKEWRKPYEDPKLGLSEGEKDFYATITHFDKKLGELRMFLKKQKLDKNTIILFLTDNGTSGGEKVFNAGMKGKKGSQYEGGHRVPLFIHWPDGGLDEGRDIDQLTMHIDILPTLIEWCKLETPPNGHLPFDGRSLNPLIENTNPKWKDRFVVMHSQNVREVPVRGLNSLVMTSKWRLIRGKELYDIQNDRGQKHNVADKYPEVVAELNEKYNAHWDALDMGNNPYPRVIIGNEKDAETWLSADAMIHDNSRAKTAMQALVYDAKPISGFWPVDFARAGKYRFEVYRWPKELNQPMNERLPQQQDADIFAFDKPVLVPQGKAIHVKEVRLRVGGFQKTVKVENGQTAAVFEWDVMDGPNLIRATMMNDMGKEFGAYHVYVTRLKDQH